MNVDIGTVFRWNNFPFARYGEKDKARWFIRISSPSTFLQTSSVYLCTTTTKLDNFSSSGTRRGHDHFIFKISQFPFFEEDCAIDFDEKPYVIDEKYLLSCEKDLEVKGKLDDNKLRMIYNRLLPSHHLSFHELSEIHDGYNRAGITGLKKPKRRK